MGEHPFILEFPVQEASLWSITNQRRIREHRRLTLVLNLLLSGTTRYLTSRPRHFWACVNFGPPPEFKWVQEWYFAQFGEVIVNEHSTPNGEKLNAMDKEIGQDGLGLRIPDDLDDLLFDIRHFLLTY